MVVYRIARDKYIHDLSGSGAKMCGGRWNKPGTAALYTSEARSLAMLELLVHFNSAAAFNRSYYFAGLEIDEDKITEVKLDELPSNYGKLNLQTLWNITDKYFDNKEILGLRVPSIIIPQEYNLILNPLCYHYHNVKITYTEAAEIDAQFRKSY